MDKADEWVLTQCGREVIALRRERDKWERAANYVAELMGEMMGGMMAGMMGCEWCPLAVYNPENGWNPCGRGYGTVECQDDVKAWLLADAIGEAEKGE
jgi:hypothetical protein